MTDFLRRHSLATLLISVILIGAGSWALFFQDSEDLSGTAMLLALAGFVSSCVGFVGLMIIVFRPIKFSRADAGLWEVTRLDGRRRFMLNFPVVASPFLIGASAAMWVSSDIVSFLLVFCLFLGVSLLAAFALWQYFQREHMAVTGSASGDSTEKQRGADARRVGGATFS